MSTSSNLVKTQCLSVIVLNYFQHLINYIEFVDWIVNVEVVEFGRNRGDIIFLFPSVVCLPVSGGVDFWAEWVKMRVVSQLPPITCCYSLVIGGIFHRVLYYIQRNSKGRGRTFGFGAFKKLEVHIHLIISLIALAHASSAFVGRWLVDSFHSQLWCVLPGPFN